MRKTTWLKIWIELIWWYITLGITFGVLYPIVSSIGSYPFALINAIFVVVFITFVRYIFLLNQTFLEKLQYIKVAIVLLSVSFVFYLINGFSWFQTYMDEEGLQQFMMAIPIEDQEQLARYIRAEMIFFGVGSIISAIALPIRMIISIWRQYNDR